MKTPFIKVALLSLLILLAIDTNSYAQQNFYKYRVGASVGSMHYWGDLTHQHPRLWNYAQLSYGLQLEKSYGKALGFRLMGSKGAVTYNDRTVDFYGDFITDNPNFDRAYNFRTDILDASAAVVLYPEGWLADEKAFISPYLYGGIGVTWFDPFGDFFDEDGKRYNFSDDELVQDGDFETDLRERNIEGVPYERTTWHIPVGLGVKFRLSDRWNVDFVANGRYTFTDYLDDVDVRGNNDDWNDIYANFTTSVNYNFGLKKKSFKAPRIIADRYSELSRRDSAQYKLGGLTMADVEDVRVATKKEKKKAKKADKKADKQAEKDLRKLCFASCRDIEDRAERKLCKRRCRKMLDEFEPPVIVEENADPIIEVENRQAELDSLNNVIKKESEMRAEGKTAEEIEEEIEEVIEEDEMAEEGKAKKEKKRKKDRKKKKEKKAKGEDVEETVITEESSNGGSSTTVIMPPAAPAPQAPAPVVIPAPAPSGSSAADVKSAINEQEIIDLKIQTEILKQQAAQGNSGGGDDNKDVIIEMYKIETDRLRQESTENKIMGKLNELQKQIDMMDRGGSQMEIRKEIIIEEDGKEVKKMKKEVKKEEAAKGASTDALKEEIERLKKELEEQEELEKKEAKEKAEEEKEEKKKEKKKKKKQ